MITTKAMGPETDTNRLLLSQKSKYFEHKLENNGADGALDLDQVTKVRGPVDGGTWDPGIPGSQDPRSRVSSFEFRVSMLLLPSRPRQVCRMQIVAGSVDKNNYH